VTKAAQPIEEQNANEEALAHSADRIASQNAKPAKKKVQKALKSNDDGEETNQKEELNTFWQRF